jgi:DNA-binding transcriptional MerR regulator
MKKEQKPPLLTSEAARILRIAPQTLRLWERLGCIDAVKTSTGVRLFDPAEVARVAREREARPQMPKAVEQPKRSSQKVP